MSIQVSSNQQTHSLSFAAIVLQNLAVILFGMILLYAVGFQSLDAVHNSAHDTRHSFAFPCH